MRPYTSKKTKQEGKEWDSFVLLSRYMEILSLVKNFQVKPNPTQCYISGASLTLPTLPNDWIELDKLSQISYINQIELPSLLKVGEDMTSQCTYCQSNILQDYSFVFPFNSLEWNITKVPSSMVGETPHTRSLSPMEIKQRAVKEKEEFDKKWGEYFRQEIQTANANRK